MEVTSCLAPLQGGWGVNIKREKKGVSTVNPVSEGDER